MNKRPPMRTVLLGCPTCNCVLELMMNEQDHACGWCKTSFYLRTSRTHHTISLTLMVREKGEVPNEVA